MATKLQLCGISGVVVLLLSPAMGFADNEGLARRVTTLEVQVQDLERNSAANTEAIGNQQRQINENTNLIQQIVRTISDFDKDGFTTDQGDCDDTDPTISPAVEEICGDGKDNDCDGYIDSADPGGCIP